MSAPPRLPWRLLIAQEDDAERATLREYLEGEGYNIIEAASGTAALETARSELPDLIVLDVVLPGMSGLDLCRQLRAEMDTPILILTARGTEPDKLVGFQLGADAYVTKPFSLNELVARIAALLRRVDMSRRDAQQTSDVAVIGRFRLDRSSRQVHVGAEEVRLSLKEFELLALLVGNPGRALTRRTIIRHVWGSDFRGEEKTVNVHVRSLREKFDAFRPAPFRISTVFGVGYRLDRPAADYPVS